MRILFDFFTKEQFLQEKSRTLPLSLNFRYFFKISFFQAFFLKKDFKVLLPLKILGVVKECVVLETTFHLSFLKVEKFFDLFFSSGVLKECLPVTACSITRRVFSLWFLSRIISSPCLLVTVNFPSEGALE